MMLFLASCRNRFDSYFNEWKIKDFVEADMNHWKKRSETEILVYNLSEE